MPLAWKEQLRTKLIRQGTSKKSHLFAKKYSDAFPLSYIDTYSPETAVKDIDDIEKLSQQHPLGINFYLSTKAPDYSLHLRLFQWQKSIPLSDILPMLENFGLRTVSESAHKITLKNDSVWISDFIILYPNTLDIKKIKFLFEDALQHIYFGMAENDGFNKLVLSASLSWQEITILRAYAKYLRQVGFKLSQAFIEKTLVHHAAIAKEVVRLFVILHDPNKRTKVNANAQKVEQGIYQALENVSNLDEDHVIRCLCKLIKATLRTNYFQHLDGHLYLSIKLDSRALPELLPLPIPVYEIFVYSSRFEAIHLRNTNVSRGGIRWSDRSEDFRTEILGLMKAQTVKNALIVPSGSKGGFVLKNVSTQMTREEIQEEAVACYKLFIRGLLDITDNIKGKKVIHPKQVICFDGEDPYLVVAADKGTASFSDIANSISKEYGFWLGDAFASGGKTGYDHKKMGITARGAWESIKRHFRELNIDIQKTSVSMVGIGDMSGDVFGNGLLYSNRVKLVAAFDNRHIFIDPDPHPQISYEERKRLFKLPASSWNDYNKKLLSRGGGVFSRNQKSIVLTPAIRKILDIRDDALEPNELIRAILKAPVDLLFNGGIGTYIKASIETHADVGDRANEYCRVNGNELRCKVVGEGGNLGVTQLGRVEFAKQGGLINTDFIDNSAGVDCSDHEVNFKILLDRSVKNKKLAEKKRNQLLIDMTKEVEELVLNDNYRQALVVSFSAFHSEDNVGLHQNYIKDLESLGILNRQVEYLPDDKKLTERKANGKGLTRPELAVLLAYTKIHIKQELLKSNIPEDSYLSMVVETAFPGSIKKDFKKAMYEHPLHRDIIATQLSNQMINEMGITFAYRLYMEMGATVDEVTRAYAVSSRIFGTKELQAVVESLDFKISATTQFEMLYNIRNLIYLATRWFLRSTYLKQDLQNVIAHFSKQVKVLEEVVPRLMAGNTKEYLDLLTHQFLKEGLPEEMARRIATYRAIYTSLNIIDVAQRNNFDLIKTAEVYFDAGERIKLLWFRDQISQDKRQGHWNTMARLNLRDELDLSQRALTIAIINGGRGEKNVSKLIQRWFVQNQHGIKRWEKFLTTLYDSPTVEYFMFFIAMRELFGLILSS